MARNKFTAAGNHEYMETHSKNSILQSSKKSNWLWLTLCLSWNLHLLKFNQRNILFVKEDLTLIFYVRHKNMKCWQWRLKFDLIRNLLDKRIQISYEDKIKILHALSGLHPMYASLSFWIDIGNIKLLYTKQTNFLFF